MSGKANSWSDQGELMRGRSERCLLKVMKKIRRVTKERHDVMNFKNFTSIPLIWDGGRRTGNLIESIVVIKSEMTVVYPGVVMMVCVCVCMCVCVCVC